MAQHVDQAHAVVHIPARQCRSACSHQPKRRAEEGVREAVLQAPISGLAFADLSTAGVRAAVQPAVGINSNALPTVLADVHLCAQQRHSRKLCTPTVPGRPAAQSNRARLHTGCVISLRVGSRPEIPITRVYTNQNCLVLTPALPKVSYQAGWMICQETWKAFDHENRQF